jgi:hypothetical protein
LNTARAAVRRVAASGDSNVSEPMAELMAPRILLLRRTGFTVGGVPAIGAPVIASTSPSPALM